MSRQYDTGFRKFGRYSDLIEVFKLNDRIHSDSELGLQ
jgi:hypothetical protein